jgi:hypothetical protein
MGWHRLDLERLAKVLALASSNRDGEALSALRKAEKMLTAVGLGLADLAETVKRMPWADGPAEAASSRPVRTSVRTSEPVPRPARLEVEMLMRRLTALHEQLNEAARVAAESASEADRWRDIAWDAARYICSLEVELAQLRGGGAVAPPAGHHDDLDGIVPDSLKN